MFEKMKQDHSPARVFLNSVATPHSTFPKPTFLTEYFIFNPYLPCVVNNAEICFVLQLSWLLELGVGSLLLDQLFHKRLVSSFREPTFFIQ